MRTPHVILTSLAVFLLAITWFGTNSVEAMKQEDVCYQVFFGEDPAQVIRLNVKRHSRLTTRAEEKELGHPRQTTYSAIGKVTNQSDVDLIEMFSANGSVLVARDEGARMALTVIFQVVPMDGPPGGVGFIECGSTEALPTPETWDCKAVEIRNGALGVPVGPAEFRRVDPLEQPLCSAWNTFNEPQ